MKLMYDTTDSPVTGMRCPIPPGAQAVAGYVGGRWPTFSDLCRLYPHADHLSIAVNAGEDADCLDIENGDATPGEAPAWVRRQQARGVRLPVLYASASVMPDVLAALQAAGIARSDVRLWEAHYDGVASVPPGRDAKQFTDRGPRGENYDVSIVAETFFGDTPSPHYDWLPKTPVASPFGRVNEFDTVVEWDRHVRDLRAPRARLLRARMLFLAARIWTVAHRNPARPDWTTARRGWRWQQLRKRALRK